MTPAARAMSPEDRAIAEAFREFGERLADPWWRITSGSLYQIILKGDATNLAAAKIGPFIPNPLQLDFLRRYHHRNVILKCRQVGFSTLISIMWLDHAMWVADQRCAQIAEDMDLAMSIFRDKVRFAFDRIPAFLKPAFPLKTESKRELHFAHNNSLIYVDTSTRGGTVDRLHISEYGKISVKAPIKAKEIQTGAFPSVPIGGVAIAESTAEGQEGVFYDLSKMAEARARDPRPLRPLEWTQFFYAWWEHDEYRIDPEGVTIAPADHQYFNEIEAKVIRAGKRPHGFHISLEQRAWYVEYRRNTFSGSSAKMWQEMPSVPEEAWLRSPEGVFYAEQLTEAVAQRRIRPVPHASFIKVDTFWDIGSSDGTAIWLMQHVHPEYRLLRFVEGWFKPFGHFVRCLDAIAEEIGVGFLWGTHYLPHDARHARQTEDRVISPVQVLQELKPSWRFEIVPPVAELRHGIEATQAVFGRLTFNVDDSVDCPPLSLGGPEQASDCRRGIEHLWNYRKRRNQQTGGWMDEPVKNDATEAADALRQFAQAFDRLNPTVRAGQRPKRAGVRRRMS